jgi:hypothetical protein
MSGFRLYDKSIYTDFMTGSRLLSRILPAGNSNPAARRVITAGISAGASFDIIIGKNIISRGDFTLSNVDDKTVNSHISTHKC